MKKFFTLLLVLSASTCYATQWVDTLYHYDDTTLSYGSAIDFGGQSRDLQMDISVPNDDTPPPNGRPLMVLIHGGAFMAGTKNDPGIVAMRKDFAKRGYVTAAINYRLGMFQPASDIHCNISYFDGVEWDCLNQTDTLEWSRAYYRGIQDAHGAIRWLVNHAADYNIDPQNIFVVGESAGAFIAMGVGFMDDAAEMPTGVGAIGNAPLPNVRYETGCLQRYGTGTTNQNLQLSRPDLGSYLGSLNQPAATPYRIKGVGDLYGAMFKNLFQANANPAEIPCIYIFHQPADLIVPNGYNRLFAGYAYCATLFPFTCVYIQNRPFCYGGSAIKGLIDARIQQSLPAPDYLAAITTNNADCSTQISNPGLGGHQLDNYWTRSYDMAVYFAPKVATGLQALKAEKVQLYPNPNTGNFKVSLPSHLVPRACTVYNLMGQMVYQSAVSSPQFELQLPAATPKGSYILELETQQGRLTQRFVLQ